MGIKKYEGLREGQSTTNLTDLELIILKLSVKIGLKLGPKVLLYIKTFFIYWIEKLWMFLSFLPRSKLKNIFSLHEKYSESRMGDISRIVFIHYDSIELTN